MKQALFPSKAVNALIAVLSVAIVLAVLFLLDRSRPNSMAHEPAVAAAQAPAGVSQEDAPIEDMPVITVVARASKTP